MWVLETKENGSWKVQDKPTAKLTEAEWFLKMWQRVNPGLECRIRCIEEQA